MDPDCIPDDIWICIFEHLTDPAQLAVLIRTCRRFNNLASKLLLHELRWGKSESTTRNLGAWSGVYRDFVALPRKLTLGVAFDSGTFMRGKWHNMTPEMLLHDLIHAQIPLFTSLRELHLDGSVVTPYTYKIVASMATLRVLQINNCTYLPIHRAFGERAPDSEDLFTVHPPANHLQPVAPPPGAGPHHPNQAHVFTPLAHMHAHMQTHSDLMAARDPPPFDDITITHLALHKGTIPPEHESSAFHPLHLITAPNLEFLSITWTSSLAATYAPKKWKMHKLKELDVVMPLLTRDLLDALVGFVGNCVLDPRIRICIERHNLSEQQIGTVQVPLQGVWSFKGPLTIAACSCASAAPGFEPTLTHLIMNEPLDLPQLLDGLEKLPKSLVDLEIQIRNWDMEVLFAVRTLLPGIQRLVIRYGKGVLPSDFFVTLGSGILFDLHKLHTIKILEDENCTVVNRPLAMGQGPNANLFNGGGGGGGGHFHNTHLHHHPTPHNMYFLGNGGPSANILPHAFGHGTHGIQTQANPTLNQLTSIPPAQPHAHTTLSFQGNINQTDHHLYPSYLSGSNQSISSTHGHAYDFDFDMDTEGDQTNLEMMLEDLDDEWDLSSVNQVALLASSEVDAGTGNASTSTSTSAALPATASSSSAFPSSSTAIPQQGPQITQLQARQRAFLRYQRMLIENASRQSALSASPTPSGSAGGSGSALMPIPRRSRWRQSPATEIPTASPAIPRPNVAISSPTVRGFGFSGRVTSTSSLASSSLGQEPRSALEHSDLGDYLVGWNRYCRSLRHVQLAWGSWWQRKFEGDRWVEKRWRDGGGESEEPGYGTDSA